MSTRTASRRTSRRHPTPPPPSPKILHFPRSRRTRRKLPKSNIRASNRNSDLFHQSRKVDKLENLFHQENQIPVAFFNSQMFQRRERVEEDEDKELGDCDDYRGGSVLEEEKWKFQAEILRAECNFLRMEREFALKKLERNRVKMERTLKSAVQTLVTGRKKIVEGKSVNLVLEEEIGDLAVKLEELQRNSRLNGCEVPNCSNFDKKACILQHRLEKIGGLPDRDLPESNLSIDVSRNVDKSSSISDARVENKSTDMMMLKKKVDGISKGMLDRVEAEYGSMLSSTANSSVASSASISKQIDQFSEFSAFSTGQVHQDQMLQEEHKCTGQCKAIVRKIVEQVRAETEQWSQMQDMLGQVRGEMEQLQTSRDYWENRAHNSDYEIQTLRHTVEEWRDKALRCEDRATKLELELSVAKEELERSKQELCSSRSRDTVTPLRDMPLAPLGKQLRKEKLLSSFRFKENNHDIDENICNEMEDESKGTAPTKNSPLITLGKQLAKEKWMLIRRLKENRHTTEEVGGSRRVKIYGNSKTGMERSPLRDIENAPSPLTIQSSRTDFPLQSHEKYSITRQRYRK